MGEIRLLQADEIEVRVQTVKEKGYSLLLYKDARVDMRILDETFGVNGWQRTHEVINGNLFCNIDIWDNSKACWVRKQDVGVESQTEKEKGRASDSFKRAGFNIGIGRELYTSPFIWVQAEPNETYNDKGKFKLSPTLKFSVKTIEFNDKREIVGLEIVDNKGKVRFSTKVNKGTSQPDTEQPKPRHTTTPPPKPKPNIDVPISQAMKCSVCDDDITEKIYSYSKTKFGKPLCFKCQKGGK